MGAKVVLEGLDDLSHALKQSTPAMVRDATAIIDRRAQNAGAAIKTEYARHDVTGSLSDHVTVAVTRSEFGVSATVRSTAPHAHLYEFGTAIRETASGAGRGAMFKTPKVGRPVVIPIAMRERHAMNGELVQLVKDAGFEVSGTLG